MKKTLIILLTALLLISSCSQEVTVDAQVYNTAEMGTFVVNGISFSTLQDAVDYVNGSKAIDESKTIYLTKDSSGPGALIKDSEICIDFSGYEFSFTNVSGKYGEDVSDKVFGLTIKDGSNVSLKGLKEISLYDPETNLTMVYIEGSGTELTIEDAPKISVEDDQYVFWATNGAKLTIGSDSQADKTPTIKGNIAVTGGTTEESIPTVNFKGSSSINGSVEASAANVNISSSSKVEGSLSAKDNSTVTIEGSASISTVEAESSSVTMSGNATAQTITASQSTVDMKETAKITGEIDLSSSSATLSDSTEINGTLLIKESSSVKIEGSSTVKGTLDVSDSNVYVNEDSSIDVSISAKNESHVIVNNNEGIENTINTIDKDTDSRVIITGGTVSIEEVAEGSDNSIEVGDKGKIVVNSDSQTHAEEEVFSYYAKAGKYLYLTLEEAIENSDANTEIILLQNRNTDISIPADKDIILNLGGKTISSITNEGSVKLSNGNVTGTIYSSGDTTIESVALDSISVSGGKTTIETATVNGPVNISESSEMEINGGTYNGEVTSAGTVSVNDGSFSSIKIEGGSTSIDKATVNNSVTVSSNSSLEINGGEYNGTLTSAGETTVNDGSFSSVEVTGGSTTVEKATVNKALSVSSGSEVVINGGTYNSTIKSEGTTTINSGKVKSVDVKKGKTTINSATVNENVSVAKNSEIVFDGTNCEGKLVSEGTSTVKSGTVESIEITNGKTVIETATVNSSVSVSEGSEIQIDNGTFNGTLTTEGTTTVNSGTIKSVDVKKGKTSINTATVNDTVSVAENSEIVLDGTNCKGKLVSEGKTTVKSGTVESIEVSKGKTVIETVTVNSSVTVAGGSEIQIEDGTFNGTLTTEGKTTVENGSFTSIEVSGGETTINSADVSDSVSVSNNSSIAINGGTINGTVTNDGGNIEISGGTVNSNPSDFVPEGYVAVLEDGEWVIKREETTESVFGIGKNRYTALQDAIDNAKQNDTVLLFVNYTPETVTFSKSLTLDLQSHSVTGSATWNLDTGVTVTTDSSLKRLFRVPDNYMLKTEGSGGNTSFSAIRQKVVTPVYDEAEKAAWEAAGLNLPTVRVDGNEISATSPFEPDCTGTYTAEFTFEGNTISVDFTL